MSVEALCAAADALLAAGQDPSAILRAHLRSKRVRTLPAWQVALRILAASPGPLSSTGVARRSQLPAPSAHQAIATLRSMGLVAAAEHKVRASPKGPLSATWALTDAGRAELARITASLEVAP